MKQILIALVVLVIVALGTYYFVFRSSPTPTAPATTETYPMPSATQPSTAPATATTISIENFSFSPSTISIRAGTKVLWKNNDSVAHTVTSDSGGLLNSQDIAPGQSFAFTFATPGSFSYHCAIHPMMMGTVTVTN